MAEKAKEKKEISIVIPISVTDKFEGARIVNGKHKRSVINENLQELILVCLGPYLQKPFEQGTEIVISMNITLFPENEEDIFGDSKETQDIGNDPGTSGKGD